MVEKIFFAIVIFFIIGCVMGFSLNDCLGRDVPQPEEVQTKESSGVIVAVSMFWASLTRNTDKVRSWRSKFNIVRKNVRAMHWRFIQAHFQWFFSIVAFVRLSRAGFRITYSDRKDMNWTLYRFWWKDQSIDRFPDIDQVGEHYSSVFNGRSVRLW